MCSMASRLSGKGFAHALGREPDMDEIAAEVGMPRADITIALESISDPISLYEPVYSDSGDTLYVMDQLSDHESDESWIAQFSIRDAIRALGDREKTILRLRYYQGRTQTEVAREIGISQAQVSRLEKAALKQLEKYVRL